MTATTALPVKSDKRIDSVWPSIWEVVQERGLKAGDQLPSIRELAERLNVDEAMTEALRESYRALAVNWDALAEEADGKAGKEALGQDSSRSG